jgi:PAS domain-containing protein
MIGSDGVVRAAGGNAAGRYALGQDVNGTKLGDHMRADGGATFQDIDPATGEERMVTVRKIRGHPLWVSVSVAEDDIFKRSWENLLLHGAVGIVLTLLILGAMEQILRTEDKARNKAEQLHLTLENMSQGIMLVTKDLQIPIINSRCGELLNLPPEFVEHPPRFDQLVEFQTRMVDQRNEEGSAAKAQAKKADTVADATQFTMSERKMPDGTVIEIRSGHLRQFRPDFQRHHEAA